MSVARFIADQRTNYRVPHTITCLLLGVSLAWFYKWRFRFRSSRISAASDRDWPGLGTMPSFQAALPGKPDLTCFSSNVAFRGFDQSTPGGSGRWLWI